MPLIFDQVHIFLNTFMRLHTHSDEFRVEGSFQLLNGSFKNYFLHSTLDLSFYFLKLDFSIDYFQFRQFQHGFEVAHFMVIDCTYEHMFNVRFDTIKSGGEILSNYNSQSQGSQMGSNSAVYINQPINAQRF